MPVLAPTRTSTPPLPPDPLAIPFFGRSLAEYVASFALELDQLRGRDVLDVASGPASFVAEACARRINAVGVDPLYSAAPAELAGHVQLDYARLFAQIRSRSSLYRLKAAGYRSLAEAEADRHGAAQRFLDDFAVHCLHGRYVGGVLPRLPFFDRTFDLVLCGQLLFVSPRFDFDWHVAACRELVRVSAGEVRINPVCSGDGRPYPGIARLRRDLRAAGIASELVSVDYEFIQGGGTILVLRRSPS
jgi:SAM-dependent methyltransferase